MTKETLFLIGSQLCKMKLDFKVNAANMQKCKSYTDFTAKFLRSEQTLGGRFQSGANLMGQRDV